MAIPRTSWLLILAVFSGCKEGVNTPQTPTCGGVTCPYLPGYTISCNAQGHCEYANLDNTGWRQFDVWIFVPPGSFFMGSPHNEDGRQGSEMAGHSYAAEEPVHRVTFKKGFFIAKYEVTVMQYEACMAEWPTACTPISSDLGDSLGWGPNTSAKGRSNHPQNSMTWWQAHAVCSWMCPRCRLLTEAEWEYAASGPKHRKYPWGDEEPNCELAVWDHDRVHGRPWGCNPCTEYGCSGTSPVGSKPKGASWCGAMDMSGNVWEWVQDRLHLTYEGAPDDGRAWEENPMGVYRMQRGGSFEADNSPADLRCSMRDSDEPRNNHADDGARCARDLP